MNKDLTTALMEIKKMVEELHKLHFDMGKNTAKVSAKDKMVAQILLKGVKKTN
jgi:hypothetical protein